MYFYALRNKQRVACIRCACYILLNIGWNLFKSKLLVCNFLSSLFTTQIVMLLVNFKIFKLFNAMGSVVSAMFPIKNCLKCMFRMPNHENDWFLVVVDVFVVGGAVLLLHLIYRYRIFIFTMGLIVMKLCVFGIFYEFFIQTAWNRLNMFNRILKFLHFIMLHDSQYCAMECQAWCY